MDANLFPKFDFSDRRAELEAELAEVASSLPALRAAAATAKEAAEFAQHRYANFLQRAHLATRHGQDEASPALRQMLDDELQLMRKANGAASLARQLLENAEWAASCRRDDLEQLDKLENPPRVGGPMYEVVKRPLPTSIDDFEIIQLPGTTRAA
jgi:hypothetical protein